MKKSLLIVLFFTLSLVLSCQKTGLNNVGNNEDIISISATFEPHLATKTTETAGKFAWEVLDKIAVAKKDGTGFQTYSASSASKNTSFVGTYAELTKFAVYPSEIASSLDGDDLTVSLPDVYNIGDNHNSTRNLMVAKFDGDANPTSLSFSHFGALLCFTINNLPDNACRFVFTTNVGINGNFVLEPSGEKFVINAKASPSESEKSVTINFTAKGELTNGVKFYIPVPIGSYTGYTGMFFNASDELVGYFDTTSSFTLNRANLGHKELTLFSMIADIESADKQSFYYKTSSK